MTKVNVLAGGISAEREVSLRSGEAVASALKKAGFDVRQFDPATSSIDDIIDCDVVFPALHGAGGEDGAIQRGLEKRSIKFVGSGSRACQLTFDKSTYKALLQNNNLPVPGGTLVRENDLRNHALAKSPFVLKPYDGGSSIDTFIIRDPANAPWRDILKTIHKYGEMLIEELIDGTELTVGILDSEALPVIKVVPPEAGEFDYENKYNGASQEIVAPEDVDVKTQKAAQELALKVHQLTGCRDLSRTDIICDKSGELFLLETNTLPGMTDNSLFPKMAAAAGLPMSELCERLVKMALAR